MHTIAPQKYVVLAKVTLHRSHILKHTNRQAMREESDFNLNVSYLIFGTAFVEDRNSITLLLLDFEAKTTASEKQNTREWCQRSHPEIHFIHADTSLEVI